ncbi:MAG: hypothetical protein ACI89Z_001072 [Porticoccus sp.]|jgi:hypothetical protein
MGRMGIWPEQLADYLALVSDSIDNIPGVSGIGAKTDAVLLQHFGDIQTLLQAGDQIAGVPVRDEKNLSAKIDAYGEKAHQHCRGCAHGKPGTNSTANSTGYVGRFLPTYGAGWAFIGKAERLIDSVESGAE